MNGLIALALASSIGLAQQDAANSHPADDRPETRSMEISISTGFEFDIPWHTIDGGGGVSSGAGFEVAGTIGQPDAGTMSGGGFELAGGFWVGLGDPQPKCVIPADLNCDHVVDVSDLLILLGAWGPCPKGGECAADLNDDESVDVSDLLVLLSSWG